MNATETAVQYAKYELGHEEAVALGIVSRDGESLVLVACDQDLSITLLVQPVAWGGLAVTDECGADDFFRNGGRA